MASKFIATKMSFAFNKLAFSGAAILGSSKRANAVRRQDTNARLTECMSSWGRISHPD